MPKNQSENENENTAGREQVVSENPCRGWWCSRNGRHDERDAGANENFARKSRKWPNLEWSPSWGSKASPKWAPSRG